METGRRKRLPIFGLYMPFLAIATGCLARPVDIVRAMEPTVRAHPRLQQRLASIKTVAIMPPSARVSQIAVGGAIELMDEETAAARSILSTAVKQELGRDTGVVFTPFPAPSLGHDASGDPAAARLAAELEGTQALFEAVSASIVLHTYKHQEGALQDWRFVEKLENFDYSLGPDVQQFAKLADADALLFTSGADLRLSGGRKGLVGLGLLALFLPTFGASIYALPLLVGPAALSAALVDAPTGVLLWYNVGGHQQRGAYALTDAQSVTDMTAQVLKDFPLGTRPTRERHDRSGSPRLGGALQ